MADINFTGHLILTKGDLKRSFTTTKSFDFVATAPAMAAGVATIGFAAHEAIVMQDVAAAGWARFENLDSTNFVQIGTDAAGTFHPFVKLKAGEFCILRLGTNAPYAKADTAAVQLDYEIFQD